MCASNPLLFIIVMELIRRKINTNYVLRMMIYAGNLAILTDTHELEEEEAREEVFKRMVCGRVC